MDKQQAREIFNAAIANETDADRIAKVELLREFFTNDTFRKQFSEYVFNLSAA